MSCWTCGTDARHSDRSGCCASCGLFFKGLTAFDRHWTTPAPGERACVHPQTVLTGAGKPVFEQVHVAGGVGWRIATDQTKEWD